MNASVGRWADHFFRASPYRDGKRKDNISLENGAYTYAKYLPRMPHAVASSQPAPRLD